jgi:hypothetical protein
MYRTVDFFALRIDGIDSIANGHWITEFRQSFRSGKSSQKEVHTPAAGCQASFSHSDNDRGRLSTPWREVIFL